MENDRKFKAQKKKKSSRFAWDKRKAEDVQKKKLIDTRCESNMKTVLDKISELTNKWLEKSCDDESEAR